MAIIQDAVRKSYGNYVSDPSEEQLNQYFFLDDFDLKQIYSLRSPQSALTFAVQLGTVRFLGTFISDSDRIPDAVVNYMRHQLVFDSSIVLEDRTSTLYYQIERIMQIYHYKDFSNPAINHYLQEWLFERAVVTNERDSVLADFFIQKLLKEKIILPGFTTFERLVATVLERANQHILKLINAALTKSEKEELDSLLQPSKQKDLETNTLFDYLRAPLVDHTQKEIRRGFKKYQLFQTFQSATWNFKEVPLSKIKNMAHYAMKAKSHELNRMTKKRRNAYLIAFLYFCSRESLDELLHVLCSYYSSSFKKAKHKEEKERLKSLKELDAAALLLADLSKLLLDAEEAEDLREKIFSAYPKSLIQTSIEKVHRITRVKSEPVAIHELLALYPSFKAFLSELREIPFLFSEYGTKTAVVWQFITESYPGAPDFDHYQTIRASFPKKWQSFIATHPSLAPRAIIICGIEMLVNALKNREAYCTFSFKFNDPLHRILEKQTLTANDKKIIKQLQLPKTGSKAVKQYAKLLKHSYRSVLSDWEHNTMSYVEQKGERERLVVRRIRKARETNVQKLFHQKVKELMPPVDLSELLMEVEQRLNFSSCFYHAGENASRMKEFEISLVAVLLADACNIGLSPVTRHRHPALNADRLQHLNHNYLRAETIIQANNQIVAAQKELPLASYWGNSHVASADGIRYAVPKKSIYSGYNPKYFGRGKGVTYYNFVSDQYIGFHGMVVPGTLRDSLFLLEGLLEQPTILEPTQIMTDTAGYSEMIFGLFGLLGYQFSPRIAHSGESKLWRFDSTADYHYLQPFSNNKINEGLIEEQWPLILKVTAALKSGELSATQLIKTLQRGGKQTQLGKGVSEIGKVYKTVHQLRYLSDEFYAREILEQLNKGESRHNLCRRVFFGKSGMLYQSYYDGMEDQLFTLGMVVNAIIYWNTLYLEKVIDQLKKEQIPFTDKEIVQLSPLLFEHINFVGKYSFKVDHQLENSYRKLNTPDA